MRRGDRCCEEAGSGGEPLPAATVENDAQTRRFVRRSANISGWTVPGVILALLPKCPACIAAYIAIGTGIGISVAAATYLRMILVVVCVGMLGYLAAVRAWRFVARVGVQIRK